VSAQALPTLSRRGRLLGFAAAAVFGLPLLSLGCSAYYVQRAQAERLPLGDLLFVDSGGEPGAPPTVFLPGMTGTTTYWREAGALDLAGGARRVLLVDELGFGRSPWPDGAYTLDDHLGAIERTLKAQGADQGLTLIGHSFGAMLAVEYGARHPAAVEQVILFGTPIYRNESEARSSIGEMSMLAGLTAQNSTLARLVCILHTSALPLTARLAPLMRRDLPRAVAADGALHFWPSLHGSVENVVLSHPIEPAIAALGSRVTLVHGRRDVITSMARVREVAEAAGAALVVTDDDHTSYWRGAGELLRSQLAEASPPR
jgi:pimeloyl-ACP methyl ester carboxylesterase